MKEYDVVIVGGAIAGPVAAKFCAQYNLKTLLVEQFKVPREKPCSGIQFPYFEKIIGDPIPRGTVMQQRTLKDRNALPEWTNIPGKFLDDKLYARTV